MRNTNDRDGILMRIRQQEKLDKLWDCVCVCVCECEREREREKANLDLGEGDGLKIRRV